MLGEDDGMGEVAVVAEFAVSFKKMFADGVVVDCGWIGVLWGIAIVLVGGV